MKKEKMTERDIDRILRSIKDVREYLIKRKNDTSISEEERGWAESDEKAITDLIECMADYTASVFDDNFKSITRDAYSKERSADEWRTKSEEIERRRKLTHDALIGKIKMADGICRDSGLEEIYGELPDEYKKDTRGLLGDENRSKPGVVETRHKIADWVFQFTLGCAIIDALDRDYENDIEAYTESASLYGKVSADGVAKRIKEMTDFEEK
mgnify:FL=1